MDKGAVPNSRRSGAVVLAPITAIRIPIITDLDTDLNDAIATASDVTGVGTEIAIDPIAVIARFSSLEQAVTAFAAGGAFKHSIRAFHRIGSARTTFVDDMALPDGECMVAQEHRTRI